MSDLQMHPFQTNPFMSEMLTSVRGNYVNKLQYSRYETQTAAMTSECDN